MIGLYLTPEEDRLRLLEDICVAYSVPALVAPSNMTTRRPYFLGWGGSPNRLQLSQQQLPPSPSHPLTLTLSSKFVDEAAVAADCLAFCLRRPADKEWGDVSTIIYKL